jgi:CRISPR-associated RAMP protein (TIGR02581 family)
MKALYNQALLDLIVKPDGPVLIKAADNLDATRPDMQFVRLRMPDVDATVYLPGSSLKGVIRSCAERLLRTLELKVCDPLDDRARCKGPGGRQKRHYKDHCFACRTFGSTDLASRVLFSDAFPWPDGAEQKVKEQNVRELEKYIQVRPGVGIDRKKGSVKPGALFDLEVVTGGEFHTRIVVRNYQLWQLGLLLLVFDELNSGAQKLGFAKTRGLGKVKVELNRLEVRQYGTLARDSDRLAGVGEVETLKEYGLVPNDALGVHAPGQADLLSLRFGFVDKPLETVGESLRASDSMKSLLKGGESNGAS